MRGWKHVLGISSLLYTSRAESAIAILRASNHDPAATLNILRKRVPGLDEELRKCGGKRP
jgi:hypothetical protein